MIKLSSLGLEFLIAPDLKIIFILVARKAFRSVRTQWQVKILSNQILGGIAGQFVDLKINSKRICLD